MVRDVDSDSVDDRLRELAKASPNFGRLYKYQPLLATAGVRPVTAPADRQQPATEPAETAKVVAQTNTLVSKLWNYCNVLRDNGMRYGDYHSVRASSKRLTYCPQQVFQRNQ